MQGSSKKTGEYIRQHGFRISMHPDPFVLLNAQDKGVLQRSIDELVYQVQVLELMGLDPSAKVQLHVGGVYGDKPAGIDRFVKQYALLDTAVRDRLVIENDERLYALSNCLAIHERTGIPVLADTFHHPLLNHGEQFTALSGQVRKTWKTRDGIPMIDYSSQEQGRRVGAHAGNIVAEDFRQFLKDTLPVDMDILPEIKDKEKRALTAPALARDDPRLVTGDPYDA